MKSKSLYFLLSFLFLAACGGSSGDEEETNMDNLGGPNPIVTKTEFFGQEGNLYKPAADPKGAGPGNLVVLFSTKFSTQFESCSVVLNTGEKRALTCINNVPWTHIPYSCFGNAGRQTWRADFKCSAMSEVKVTCLDAQQEVTFTVPEEQRGHVCSRF